MSTISATQIRRKKYVYIWNDCSSTRCDENGVVFCKACNEAETPTAIAWRVSPSKPNLATNRTIPCDDGSGTEARLGTYKETSVGPQHLNPGGKYRAICKLFVYFETPDGTRSVSKEATGWCCMDSKTIATAGHVVYDEEHGRATSIEVHIGYRGTNSGNIATHESRMAICVAVHRQWYNKFANENDIALIKLQTPFDKVLPLHFKDCPERGERMKLCIAGYPGDLPSEGQFMRECEGKIDFHLQSHTVMLHHRLDTFKGNSGSPVFQIGENHELEVIAVHARTCTIRRPDSDDENAHRTGRFYRVNQAVPLGHHGNVLATVNQATTVLIMGGDYGIMGNRPGCVRYRCPYCTTTKIQIR
ncbi:hypothetical protein DL98DRAFT_522608 [Cadophora sp. DSE1049]|nr:hypothetical protein DL98DRAFT_522608 [Cadophora sp. DSE1049]